MKILLRRGGKTLAAIAPIFKFVEGTLNFVPADFKPFEMTEGG
jgi:hypothetical protein